LKCLRVSVCVMVTPSTISRLRQSLGRALRETGQAIDRVGILCIEHALTSRTVGDDPCIFDIPLSRHRHVMPFLRRGIPQVDADVSFMAPCSSLIGNVHIGPQSSVWYGAILRADSCCYGLGHPKETYEAWKNLPGKERYLKNERIDASSGGGGIYIGCRTNIQDGAVVTSKVDHVYIGDDVTIGHSAQIHSSTINNNCLIGLGAVLLEGVVVGANSIIGAGSVVSKDTVVKEGELWVGNPAKKMRDLTQQEKEKLTYQAQQYVEISTSHANVMELGGNMPYPEDIVKTCAISK